MILFEWDPPFSFNLTYAEPDVAYCIDVYNATNGTLHHLISDCNVTQPQYTFTTVSNPDPTDMFEFTITPRSNLPGARNGLKSEYMQAYFHGKS